MSALVIKNVAHDDDGERLEVVFCLDIRRMKLKNRTSKKRFFSKNAFFFQRNILFLQS